MLPVAVLAGGLATRLGSITTAIPKLLLDLNGRPFAAYQLRWLKSEGVTDVVYCLGHLSDQVIATLGDGSQWGMRFQYVVDGPTLLGTGGALQRALPLLGDRFFVLYGDSLLTCNLSDVERAHQASGRRCLMTVFENAGRWDTSNIVYRNGEIVAYDKVHRVPDMRYIDYGLGVLTPEPFLAYTPGEPLDLATVYQDQLRNGQLAAYEVHTRFYEIGSREGLEETRRFLAAQSGSV
jgi:NDP-sugar pyrophosphorylase family protein